MPLKVIISGAPASGKGTQCELIQAEYGVVHLSTGDMLRAAVASGSGLGKEAKRYMDGGELVPDALITDVVLARLAEADCRRLGWLLDGFPRTAAQSDALTEAGIVPDAFVMLDVPDAELIERVEGRRTDPKTGKIYHIKSAPPPAGEIAARCEQRSDDTKEKVVVRLKAFHEQTQAVLTAYETMVQTINGSRTKAEIFADIQSHLNSSVPFDVIFVLGAPGSGKTTQCEKIAAMASGAGVGGAYVCLSPQQLLSAERKKAGSDFAKMIDGYIKQGQIVPVEITVGVIKKAMVDSGARRFVIDGFPKNLANIECWYEVMASVAVVRLVVFFDLPERLVQERLLARRGIQDTLETIRRRLRMFHSESMPCLAAFERLGLVRAISAQAPRDVVFSRVQQLMSGAEVSPPPTRTCAVIQPDARFFVNDIVRKIEAAGFVVCGRVEETLTASRAATLYAALDPSAATEVAGFAGAGAAGAAAGASTTTHSSVSGTAPAASVAEAQRHRFERTLANAKSGPTVGLLLEYSSCNAGCPGIDGDAVSTWQALMGPVDVSEAKRLAPNSLRALFGTDAVRCAVDGSESIQSVLKDTSFWFGGSDGLAQPAPQRTLALIKPVVAELHEPLIRSVLAAHGFTVVTSTSTTMTRLRAEQFFGAQAKLAAGNGSTAGGSSLTVRQQGGDDGATTAAASDSGSAARNAGDTAADRAAADREAYSAQLDYMSSSPTVALLLERAGAVKAWAALIGPADSAAAKRSAPMSLRARLGDDAVQNALHGSETLTAARRETHFWFPGDVVTAGRSAPPEASGEYRELLAYMDTRVDPVFAPLLNRVLEERPKDVLEFALRELAARQHADGPHPLVIAGPSGVGKGTLIKKLVECYPTHFGFCVSHTTRDPRPGESDGIDYYFLSREAMDAQIADGKFIEHATVHNNLYGTSLAAVNSVRAEGKICILDIEMPGVQNVKRTSLCPKFLFIAPPSMPLLEQRLRGRGTESEKDILKRLSAAQRELEYGTAAGNFDRIIVNDDLESAFDELSETLRDWFPRLKT